MPLEEKKEEKPKGRLKKETNADKTNEKFIGKVKESLKNNIRKEIRDYETQEEETQELMLQVLFYNQRTFRKKSEE